MVGDRLATGVFHHPAAVLPCLSSKEQRLGIHKFQSGSFLMLSGTWSSHSS
jgi:hypothetical protein